MNPKDNQHGGRGKRVRGQATAGVAERRSSARRLAGAALLALSAALASGCDSKPPPPEPTTSAGPQDGALAGVTPHDERNLSASERPGAVAIGAVEAGQSGVAAGSSEHPSPTAGDGTASAAAPASR